MPRSTLLASLSFAFACATASACGDGGGATRASDDAGARGADPGASSGGPGAGSSGGVSTGFEASSGSGSSSGGSSSGSGSSSSGSGSSSGGSSSSSGSGGGSSPGTPDSGSAMHAGNPAGSCDAGVPTQGRPADTSHPTTVVGTGSAASCTFSRLQAAVTKGGVVTFDCGGPLSIRVSSTLNVPTDTNTVIDGGSEITLDGGGAVQILSFNSANFQANENRLTLQHISLVNGKKVPTQAIPTANPPCSQGWNDGEGGALFMRDGNLTVIDAIFTNNQAAPLGPDTGGGAIYVLGSKHGALIVGSTFTGNKASNAGAVGGLFAELDVYDSLFTGNKATGNGANNNEPSKCPAMNNGQNETGSGGNGGALYSDGNSVNVVLCGDEIDDNAAGTGAFGGGLFFTSDNMMGTLAITGTTMKGNTGGSWTNVSSGSVTKVGTAIGVNAMSITVTNSTLQDDP
jgi:hypothetical protein